MPVDVELAAHLRRGRGRGPRAAAPRSCSAAGCVRHLGEHLGRRARSRPRRRSSGARSSSTSVSARSKPRSATGPVFIDTQKQVPPAWPHCTATTNTSSAPGAIGRVGMRAAEQHAVEDPHRVQLARAGAEERVARRRRAAARATSTSAAALVHACRATASPRAAAGSASTSAGRPRSRTAPRRRGVAAGSGRRPARRSSRSAGPPHRWISS